MRLNVSAFALAFGIWWGVGMFLTTWWLIGVGGVIDEPTMMERVYIGYHITPVGSLVGLAWGFVPERYVAGFSRGYTTSLPKGSAPARSNSQKNRRE
jgi:hypothetical protein